MIVFVDTEVDVESRQVVDFGIVREDGACWHTHSVSDFESFLSGAKSFCGHNVINHDLLYMESLHIEQRYNVIDTLYLSPLLFPKRPYHKLLKDEKLLVDELNNPVNDAKKARDLYYDEVDAWHSLSPAKKAIFYSLLRERREFAGFFRQNKVIFFNVDVISLILQEYDGKICVNADLYYLVTQYPVELSYALAVIGVDDALSLTPAWVMRNYPGVSNVLNILRSVPCGCCSYCKDRLDSHRGLKMYFGYDEFRVFDGSPMQQQAVEAAIRGDSLLTIFPTGGGKSLTFQLPALMAGRNVHGLTVVISPLQSLMKDQVDNLVDRGICNAVTINGLLDPIERSVAIQQVIDGTANLLYIAPEMLRSKTVERLLLGRNVVRFVIDEAHCFSAWGHDFRVDYLYIGDFIKRIQKSKMQKSSIAVSCFTATAKQKVISDICDYFKKNLNLDLILYASSSERHNLRYTVLHADTDEDKYNQLRSLILGNNCPTIVYVSRTKRTREISHRLCSDGIMALPFNGKMDVSEKVANQNAFMSGQVSVIVATSAFGMGVDKKDVGLVVHYDISDSLENYIQEAGRAGRDPNMQAACYVLFGDDDLDKHFIMLNQTKLSLSEIQQVWRVVKDLTATNRHTSCSALEIARLAGWGDDVQDIETRVKAAIAALEEVGFVSRGNNVPHVFATGLSVRSVIEARKRISESTLFDEKTAETAIRIISSLIGSKNTSLNMGMEAESRVDYIADVLGLPKDLVISCITKMRMDGLLTDSRDMQAWVEKGNVSKLLNNVVALERFLLNSISEDDSELNYKLLNEKAHKEGITVSSVKRLKRLIHFLSLKKYIYREEYGGGRSVLVRLQSEKSYVMNRFEQRVRLCRFVVDKLLAERSALRSSEANSIVGFSMIEMLRQYNATLKELLFEGVREAELDDIEEVLLYLTKNDLMKIEGGFLVVYNSLQINRNVDRRARYGREQYRLLDEFYKQRIQQIHIVGEYANLMVRDYNAALQYVNDYFLMDYKFFVNKYFKGERRAQISQNISPEKYAKLFGALSRGQREIIEDGQSKYIVVAAGPGSGKTRVLVHKLASLLLLEDVKHEQLLMLTFSRSAATEFKKRLIDLVGNAAHFVDVKTFHSYCFDLIGKQGSLEDASNVVGRAVEMILNGEVEESKVSKSVLVIDEAQDMGKEDFDLVQALISRNEEMRVIAVGDDDQNIYRFRGSDSSYFGSLVKDYNASFYEMTDNYRSDCTIVDFANSLVSCIPNRMKSKAIMSTSMINGTVEVHRYDNAIVDFDLKHGSKSACVLTLTNEESMQVAYCLEQKGVKAKLIQSIDGFRFANLAEIRYFLNQIGNSDLRVVSREQWNAAKKKTMDYYSGSTCLDIMKRFFDTFESTHRMFYRSDLSEFISESEISDFVSAEDNMVVVSTIHKSKGREFDTVYLLLNNNNRIVDDDMMRLLYVGLTRAKHNLLIHTTSNLFDGYGSLCVHKNELQERRSVAISLTLKDVYLGYVKDKKSRILKMKSGDKLVYENGYLASVDGGYVAYLSKSMRSQLADFKSRGYAVSKAEVSYVVAWKSIEENYEYAVCLANLYLDKS